MRRDHSLLKAQYLELEKSNNQRMILINAQQAQLAAKQSMIESLQHYSSRLEKEYKKQKFNKNVFKIATPLALVVGFILGSK